MLVTRQERPTEAVRRDYWDRKDFEHTLELLDGMTTAKERLAEHTEFAEDLVADAHAAYLRPNPELTEDRLAPTHALHRAVMGQVFESDVFREARSYTVGDPLLSGVAATALTNHMPDLFSRLTDVKEKADAAQEAQEALDRLMGDIDGDTAPADADQLLADLQAQLGAAEAALDEALDDAAPKIGQVARAAARDVLDAASEEAALARMWGKEPGELARKDPRTRLRLAERMRDDRFKRIAEHFGRARFETRAILEKSWINGPAEVHSVRLGNDLALVLPDELVLLAVPGLEVEFYRKFAERQLLCYSLRERAKTERGPIVVTIDASGSMHGTPIEWTIGMSLGLLSVARAQKRGFVAIVFRDEGNYETFEFVKPADFEIDRMLDFASVDADGGTGFMAPLGVAADYATGDHATTGLKGADVLFLTDGYGAVDKDWLAEFTAKRDTAGFRVWGVAIQQAVPQVLLDICNLTARVDDFVGVTDLTSIFQAVGQNYEPAVR